MNKVIAVVCLLSLIAGSNPAQERKASAPEVKSAQASAAREEARASQSGTAKLPVRRLVLYKNGVGYFEHLGRVRGNQEVHIDFTSAQLNDVLKSLTVLDLSGGRITGVDYNSEAPLARRLATLRLAVGERPTVAEFLGALRGARVEVRGSNGVAVAGKLLSVERKTRTGTGAGWTVETDEVSLITDSGEVRSVDLNPTTSVRIADHDLNVEVGKYLGLIASARDQDVRRMTVSTTGTGDRNLYVSYISEVPIWKTTYRIVLPVKAEKKPLLQGWAIVDNTVGEDWNDVELSLVAGAPHSFIQQLSEPYYGRRPVAPLPESVQLTPQTHAATLEVMGTGSGSGGGVGSGAGAGAGYGVAGGVAGGSMGGIIGGVVGMAPHKLMAPAPPPMPESTEIEEAQEESEPVAEGSVSGDLFEYSLKDRVTIRKNQSALVPILQTDIAADRVSLWSESLGVARPLRALWLTNTSALTLDGGSFSVLDSETFAGEGILDAIKPGERRLLSYATDLGMTVDSKVESRRERTTRARIYRGTMVTTSEEREKKTYVVRNEDVTPRELVIEHPERPEWKLGEDAPKPEEKAAGLYRFRLKVEPKKTERLVVNEGRLVYVQYALNAVTDDQIGSLLVQKAINPEIEKALRGIVAQKNVVVDLKAKIDAQQKGVDQIFTDQGRLRENMKALKGSAEEKALLQRYTRQLDDQETQIATLRKKIRDTEAQRDAANAALEKLIEGLEMETTL